MSLAAGTRLGPYEIVAPLGAGGMGEVYRARDTRLRREVAIKVLAASFAESSEHRRDLRGRGERGRDRAGSRAHRRPDAR
jgi:serine/threonine protein kinase